MLRRGLAVALIAAALACGGQDPPRVADLDPADRFFDRSRILEVRIEMAAAAWTALRAQTRRRLELLEGDCLAEPFTSPFTYFEAAVEIDGERRTRVGVRKKGFIGSMDSVRPSLKVHYDEYTAGGNLYGLDHLTLNNSRQDSSYLHQCFSYDAFTDAGLPSPRCNFVHLVVNNEDLGVYVNVETIDKDFLARHFEDEDGDLFKATFGDFRPGWTGTFDSQNEGADPAWIQKLLSVLESAPDGELRRRVAEIIDLDRFLTYWAVEVLLLHWDGYAYNQNNYYVYGDPRTGRIVFLPWGTDGVFRTTGLTGPTSVFARGALTRRLYMNPETRDLYVARLREVMAAAWDEPRLLAETDRLELMIRPVVQRAGGSVSSLTGAIEGVRTFLRTRRGAIDKELSPDPPVWTQALRSPPCHRTVGQISSRVVTTFGTHGADPFRSGTGQIGGTLNQISLGATAVGATIGADPAAPTTRVILTQASTAAAFGTLTLACPFERFRLVPGAVIPLDFSSTAQCNLTSRAGSQSVAMGRIVNGAITIEQGATTNGAAVAARIEGTVIQ